MPGEKPQCGFSLVELMVAMTLLLLLAVIAVPALNDMLRQNTVRSQANSLLALLQFARSEAIKQQQNVQLTMTDTETGWRADVIRVSDDESLRVMVQDVAEVTPADDAVVTFDSKGRAAATACISLSYAGDDSFDRHLNISLGGQVAVESGGCGL
jgi:type IV fimbrial biogenesis protein FimT